MTWNGIWLLWVVMSKARPNNAFNTDSQRRRFVQLLHAGYGVR